MPAIGRKQLIDTTARNQDVGDNMAYSRSNHKQIPNAPTQMFLDQLWQVSHIRDSHLYRMETLVLRPYSC